MGVMPPPGSALSILHGKGLFLLVEVSPLVLVELLDDGSSRALVEDPEGSFRALFAHWQTPHHGMAVLVPSDCDVDSDSVSSLH